METTQAELYRRYDDYAVEIMKVIRDEFTPLRLAGFDELTVTNTIRRTKLIYERIDKRNRKAYREMCDWVYEWVYVQYGKNPPNKDWTKVVDAWLKGYDPVTQYVYVNELERKMHRLNEGILSCREETNHAGLEDVIRTASNYLLTQSLQTGLDLMGEMQKRAFADAEDEEAKVQYHACDDDQTCGECHADDGKIFRLSEAPRIPRHYRCRCWYTRAR